MSLKPNTKKNVLRAGGGFAVLLAAGLMLPSLVSGANFSASDTGKVTVSTATLDINLSDANGAQGTFQLDFRNLKPGQVQTQTFTVKNTGSIAGNVSLGNPISGISASLAGLNGSDLAELKIGVAGYQALTPVTQLTSASIDLGSLAAGQSRTYTMQVSLDQAAGNEWQGKSVGATATVTLNQQ
jgi:hypothetical protein